MLPIPIFILFIGFTMIVIGFIASFILDYYIGRSLTKIVSIQCSRNITIGKTFLYNIFKILIAYGIGYILGVFQSHPLLQLIIPINLIQTTLAILGLITILIIIHYLFQFKNPVCTGTYLISDLIAEAIITATIFLIGLLIGISTTHLIQIL